MHQTTILLINDFQSGGGAETIFNQIATSLSSSFTIITYSAYPNFESTSGNPLSYIYSRKHYKNVLRLAVENNVDIIHLHNFRWLSPSVFGVKNKASKILKKKVKLYLTPHDFSMLSPYAAHGYFDQANTFIPFPLGDNNIHFLFKCVDPRGHFHSWLKKAQWYLAFKILHVQKNIDVILSPSRFLGEELKLFYPNLKVALLRNPLSKSMTEVLATQRTILPLSSPIKMIYVGRIAPEKGLDKFLGLLNNIRQKQGSLDLTIDLYGSGSQLELIQNMLKEKEYSFATYKGYLQQHTIMSTLAQYNVYVMSSICYENSPLTLVESAAEGLRLLVNEFGGMKEIANICGNVFFYDIYSVTSLEKAIQEIKRTPLTPLDVVHERIDNNFNISKYFKIISEFYNAKSVDCEVYQETKIENK